ncbi:alpha-2-macroglobulin family protein [Kangiella sp. M94]
MKIKLLLVMFTLFGSNSLLAKNEIIFKDYIERQEIRIAFDKPVQRVSPTQLPIYITPEHSCNWVWSDRKNLECELYNASTLPPAASYSINVKDGLYYTDGTKIPGFSVKVSTSRPEIEHFSVHKWQSPDLPVILAYFNISVVPESLKKSTFLKSDKGDLIELTVKPAEKDNFSRETEDYKKNTGWLLTPNKPLKLNHQYQIFQTSGISTPHGYLKSESITFKKNIEPYKTFKYLGSTCRDHWEDPLKENEACKANSVVSLKFNVALDSESVESCMASIPELELANNYINSSIEVLIYKPNTDIRLACFKDVKDIFGRKLKKSDIVLRANDFDPNAENPYREEVLSINDEISLFAHTLNVDRLEVAIDYQDYVSVNHKKHLDTVPGRNKLVKTKVDLPGLSDAKQLSGSIYYDDDQTYFSNFSIQRTRYNIHFIKSKHEALFFITDLLSGEPLANTQFSLSTIYSQQQYHLIDLETNNSGIAKVDSVSIINKLNKYDFDKILFSFDDKWDSKAFLTQYHSANAAVTGSLSYESSYINEGEYWLWGITDKPIYRPGEIVNYTVYLRELRDNELIIPQLSGETVLSVSGSDYDCYSIRNCEGFYQKKDPKFDEFGTYSGQIHLPEKINDGDYSIILEGKGYFDSQAYFKVANFKTNDIKVTTKIEQESLYGSEQLDVSTKAEYFSGGPYSAGQTEVMIKVEPYSISQSHIQYGDYVFDENSCGYCDDVTEFFFGGRLDSDGLASKKLSVPKNTFNYGKITVQSSVSGGGMDDAVSRIVTIPYSSKPYFVGIKSIGWSIPSNKPYAIESVVVTPEGDEVEDIPVDYAIRKSKPFWGRSADDKESPEEDIECSQKDLNSCTFTPDLEGYYDILATIHYDDGSHQTSYAQKYFYKDSSDNNSLQDMTIHSDRDIYQVGDTATISFTNPFKEATALLIVHRNKMIEYHVMEVGNGLSSHDLKVIEEMAPGVDITINLFPKELGSLPKNSKLIDFAPSITRRVTVEPPVRPDSFKVELDDSIKQPGEVVELAIENLTGGDMKYTVAVVDESIVNQMVDAQYYDIYQSEMSPDKIRWDSPNTYTLSKKLYSSSLYKDSDLKSMELDIFSDSEMIVVTGSRLKRTDVGLGAAPVTVMTRSKDLSFEASLSGQRSLINVGGLKVDTSQLRTLFKESAYWNSDVTVESRAKKVLDIQLPDNLASWKVLVIGTRLDGDISARTASVKTQKTLETRLSIPKQLSVGDSFMGRATVISRSEGTLPEVSIAAQAKANNKIFMETDIEVFSSVISHEENKIEFDITTPETDKVVVTVLSSSKDSADGLIKSIPVSNTLIPRSNTYYAVMPAQSSILLDKITDSTHDHADMTVALSSSISSQLSGTYDYMQNYPHNCWEQRVSRALVAAYQLKSGDYLPRDKSKLLANIDLAVNHIEDFQAPNGGMSFFEPKNIAVSDFLSAHTLFAAEKLQLLGYEMSPTALKRLEAFVLHQLKDEKLSDEQRIVFLHSLSGKSNFQHSISTVYKNRKNLSHSSKGLLLGMLSKYDEFTSEAEALANEIIAKSRETNKKLILVEQDQLPWRYFNYDAKTYCNIINGMTSANVPQQTVNKLVNAALEYRRKGKGDFGNTVTNAYCTVALSEYISKFETVNDASLFNFQIEDTHFTIENNGVSKPISINIDNNSQLKLVNNPSGNTYVKASINYLIDGMVAKSESKGLSISREYSVYKNGEWERVAGESLQRSDWVKITLNIQNPVNRRFVAVTDFIPGGFFAVEGGLANSAPRALFDSLESNYYFGESQVGNRTVKFYAEFLPAGGYVIEYVAQVTHQGKFSALPAIAEEMYDDDVFGSSKANIIIVE